MKLNIRATDLQVTPSDTSGYLVRIECSDAEDVREQVLTGPDDGADDWPLAKRYREIVERSRGQQAIIAELRALLEEAERELMADPRGCPWCDGHDGHAPDCRLAVALADKEGNDG